MGAQGPVFVREDFSKVTPQEIASLRDGVFKMIALDCKAGHTAPGCEQEGNPHRGLQASNYALRERA